MRNLIKTTMAAAIGLGWAAAGQAATFDTEYFKGSFDTQLTTGFARRAGAQDCRLVGDPGTACNPGATPGQWTVGDDGNLNYNKGDLFSLYVKGTHELLLQFPEQWKFLGRVTWLRDVKADDTRRTELNQDARRQLTKDVRLLDLWVSKEFDLDGNSARVRLGNQVVSWGESVFLAGGINSTNALDLQKLNVPGTQLKEAVLPAPMLSFATGLGGGVNVEGYYQFGWNANRLAPVGSYFNAGDQFGKGYEQGQVAGGPVPLTASYEHKPRNGGQYGAALHYKPQSSQLDLGFYALAYTDKMPNVLLNNSNGALELEYKEGRRLFGVSANFPLGNWSLGSELSFRPKDAVALAVVSGACGAGAPADCHLSVDEKRWQMHVTAQLQLTPGDHAPVLNALGSDSAYLTFEAVGIRYPGVGRDKRYLINGVTYAPGAGGLPWLDGSGGRALSNVTGIQGTANSTGAIMDFNWVYDNKLIPGWQVTPGVTVFKGLSGYTPNVFGNFMRGAGSANFYVLFNQNPPKWQAGLNFTTFYGDKTAQPLGDRKFIGGFITRNF